MRQIINYLQEEQMASKANEIKSMAEARENRTNITRICLTGGPCAGKTTAMAELKSDLSRQGIKVLIVPEAARMLWEGGAVIDQSTYADRDSIEC